MKVFNGLCKAFGQEPRGIIRQAIAILTPVILIFLKVKFQFLQAIPQRMEDGHTQLINCIKKIMFHDDATNDAMQNSHLMFVAGVS